MSTFRDASLGALGERTFRNVLAVVDGPRDAPHVLAAAVPIVSASRGRLTLLAGVMEVPALAYAGASWIGETDSLADELVLRAADLLARTARSAPASIPVQTVLTRESLQKAVADRIARHGHDLVIISDSAARRRGRAVRIRRPRALALPRWDAPVVVVTDATGTITR